MIYILNLETATKNCSVSISGDGKTLALKELSEEQFNHAEKLHVFIVDILSELQLSLQDLKAVAVSKGPGSYTGLRIGVSAAKGLCFALDIPLIAVETLAILAGQLHITPGAIVPMIDARRMEVFTQVFNVQKQAISEPYALIVTQDSLKELGDEIHLLGDGASKCKEVLNSSRFVYHDEMKYPSANEMSRLSFEKYKQKDFADVAYFEPYYLKDFMLTTKK